MWLEVKINRENCACKDDSVMHSHVISIFALTLTNQVIIAIKILPDDQSYIRLSHIYPFRKYKQLSKSLVTTKLYI